MNLDCQLVDLTFWWIFYASILASFFFFFFFLGGGGGAFKLTLAASERARRVAQTSRSIHKLFIVTISEMTISQMTFTRKNDHEIST